MKRLAVLLLAGVMITSAFTGCGKKEEPAAVVGEIVSEAVSEEVEEVEEEPADLHPGQKQSDLTGVWVDEKEANKRPVGIMISNSSGALPQYGITDADVVIEAPMEGGETRFLALFQNYKEIEKVMSVRSARHYFIYWANDFDAIFAHFGYSVYAGYLLDVHYIDNLDGLVLDGTMYFRDSSKPSPHNAYTTGSDLAKTIKNKEYRTKHYDGYEKSFNFIEDENESVDMSKGVDCEVFKPGYLISKPSYVYNEEDGLYYRYQYSGPMTDGNDGSQVAVKNIIYTKTQTAGILPDSSNHGYLDLVVFPARGEGYYITDGKAVEITWEKLGEFEKTKYYDTEGNELVINQGNTWICVTDDQYTGEMGMWPTYEEYEASK